MVRLSTNMNGKMKQKEEEEEEKTSTCSCNWIYTKIKIYHFLNDGGVSAVSPYISLVAKKIGFTTSIVGIVNTLTVIVALIAKPLTGALTDRFGHHKLMWLICYIASLCCTFSIIFIPYLPEINLTNDLTDKNVSLYINKESASRVKICHKLVQDTKFLEQNQVAPCSANCYIAWYRPDMCTKYDDCRWLLPWLKPSAEESIVFDKDPIFQKPLALNFSLALNYTSWYKEHRTCQKLLIDNIELENGKFPVTDVKLKCDLQCNTENMEIVHSMGTLMQYGYDIFNTYQLWWYALVIIIAGVAKRIVEVLQTSVVYGILETKHSLFGKQKVFGSLGFGFALMVGGFLNEIYKEESEYACGFYIYAIFLILATGIIASFHVSPQPHPKNMMKAIGSVFLQFHILVFFLASFVAGTCSSFASTYSFWFLTEQGVTPMYLGLSKGAQSLLTELPCLYFSGWLINRIGHIPVITITFAVLSLKFMLYSLMKNTWVVFVTEPLAGVFYGLFYPTATSYTTTVAPSGMNTIMQGLFFTAYKGAGRMVGNLVGGLAYDALGGQTTFLLFGVACGICCIILSIVEIGLHRHHSASVTITKNIA